MYGRNGQMYIAAKPIVPIGVCKLYELCSDEPKTLRNYLTVPDIRPSDVEEQECRLD